MPKLMPRYPIYIPSKGRATIQLALTAKNLLRDKVPFYAVVEPQEQAEYEELVGAERVLVLPFSNLGQGSIPARNWIKAHSIAAGDKRHWQLDDNLDGFRSWYQKKRLHCRAGVALRVCEDFTDRYENVALSGLEYNMFAMRPLEQGREGQPNKPFLLNTHVYSCTLVLNALPYEWRGRYNEDTDMCLQVLAGGWCTVLIYAFTANKIATMKMAGGNTDELYQDDGRTHMARELERRWPGVVTVKRRWRRSQHHVNWRKFDTPLKRRADIDFDALDPNDYRLTLTQVAPIKSPRLQRIMDAATD